MAVCACPMKVVRQRYVSYEGGSWRYVFYECGSWRDVSHVGGS